MKANSATKPGKFRVALISCALAVLAAGPATAANTDIANIPLANASSTTALPNIYFILDDSGSMAWNTLPGATSQNQWVGSSRYWISSHCNGLGYNPAQTYTAPPALSSTALKATTFAKACDDGYDTGTTCATNLNNSYYYTYSGTQPDLGFTYNASGNVITTSTFYTECNASASTLFTKVTLTSGSAEAQNYANWYSYYRVRVNMAKSSIGAAFKDIRGTPKSYGVDPLDGDYFHARVGFDSIHHSNGSLSLANFDTAQKKSFYDTLYGTSAGGDTPLRTALQAAGEMYKTTGANAPIQYRCQRNYAIVTTDGYWNSSDPSLTPTNQDSSEPRPMYDGGTATGTKTEIRQRYSYSVSGTGCTSPQTKLVTQEQRDTITTKTVNGVQQTPTDSGWSNYGSATSGSCQASPTIPSPNPSNATLFSISDTAPSSTGGSSNTLSDVAMYYYKTDLRSDLANEVPATHTTGNDNIDDTATWQHMTTFGIGMGVNGTLTFDSGYKTTTDTTSAFYKILCPTGSGCSNWPVPSGDDAAAVDDLWHAAVDGHGTYFSAKNPAALAASLKQALNQMDAAVGAGAAASTSSLNPSAGGDYGYTPAYTTGDWTGDLAAYVVTGTGDLDTTATWSAATKLKARIAAGAPARVIYTSKSGGTSLADFKPATFTTTTEKAWFENSQLVQYSEEWTPAQKTAGTLDNLVNFLRGDTNYERKSGATVQLYRTRNGPIGDIVHSQPVYVGKPSFNFEDTGYAKFKADNALRSGTVYIGANDGMLHAFDPLNGSERWAYVPPMVFPNLWRLADRDYSGNHRYFVDGPIAVSDAYINNAWATVLIGTMGAGGRGYYALDVTNPASPALLWTFSADDNPNVGYAFGTPLIAKVDGVWVAILTSGYNNVPEASGTKYPSADGKGYVFVRKLSDGTALNTISTSVGSAGAPSGLATLNVHIKSSADYAALAAYGGDITGNMYRFDLSGGTESTLIALGSSQPITSAPEIASLAGKPLVFFGTGRYLGKSDMVDNSTQTIYGVKDDVDSGGTPHTISKTTELVQQTLSAGVVTASSVDWGSKYGWYINLPNTGERVNIHPQLQLGVVLFATTIPPATAADPCTVGGGSGWLYQLSYKNGGSVNGNSTVGTHLDYLPVGLSLIGTGNLGGTQSADGKASVRTGKGTDVVVDIMKPSGSATTGKATRVLWRELLK